MLCLGQGLTFDSVEFYVTANMTVSSQSQAEKALHPGRSSPLIYYYLLKKPKRRSNNPYIALYQEEDFLFFGAS